MWALRNQLFPDLEPKASDSEAPWAKPSHKLESLNFLRHQDPQSTLSSNLVVLVWWYSVTCLRAVKGF